MTSRTDFHRQGRPLRVGIIASELFAPGITPIGGFGWAARQVSRCFSNQPELGVRTTFFMTRPVSSEASKLSTLHGSPVVWRTGSLPAHVFRLRRERPDLLLAIDHQAIYRLFYWTFPRTPILVWSRDPWTPEDKRQMQSLRIPGDDDNLPQGLFSRDHSRSFPRDYRWSQRLGRRILFAVPSPFLGSKIKPTFGVDPGAVAHLPNILDPALTGIAKTSRPSVIVIGRLDPVKRPWIALSLAGRFPDVDFLFLGQKHFSGPGSWAPDSLPANVRMLDHVDGEEKLRAIASSWLLLNTSIHEGLSVTFQEALAAGTPIVSCVNPEEVVSQFGIFVGDYAGAGLESLPAFETAIRRLIADPELRQRLGDEGKNWAQTTHNRDRFLQVFHQLCRKAGVLEP